MRSARVVSSWTRVTMREGKRGRMMRAVCLVVNVEFTTYLNVGACGGVVVCEDVKAEEVIERVGGGASEGGSDEIYGEAGGGGVGVFDVKGGVGERGWSEV
eukprot:6060102-Prymnesium_polylepis.1